MPLLREMNPNEKPREKMILRGQESLSDAEVIAILLNSGNKNISAIELAEQLLNKYNINELIHLTYDDLIKIPGIKMAKATKIIASFELAKRAIKVYDNKIYFDSSKKVYRYLRSDIIYAKHEMIYILLVNSKLGLIKKIKLSEGFLADVEINVKSLISILVKYDPYGFIMAHNHPSGDSKPSKEDKYLTSYLYKLCKDIGYLLLDHIICTSIDYFSFSDSHLLDWCDI